MIEHVQIGNLYYNLNADDQTAEVTYRDISGDDYNYYLSSVTIPSSVEYSSTSYSVTGIGDAAFVYSPDLTSAIIPNSVTSIGSNAFWYCPKLTSVNIPNNVTSIGKLAFYACTSLHSIEIPNGVTVIEDGVFYYCTGLTSVEVPSTITSIGDSAFYACTSLSSIEIPSSVTSIGNKAFTSCQSLTSIEISDNVTNIGNYAFTNCTGLTSPVYNAHIFAFMPTSYKGAYSIPQGIESIAGGAFYFCNSLTSIDIPNSVTNIGYCAFQACCGFTSVEIPTSVTSIGDNAFLLVKNIVYTGSSAGSPWGANSINGFVEGYLVYSDDSKTTLLGCASAATGEVILPNSVITIDNRAFYNCNRITSIVIPNSVTGIGEAAFTFCSSLESVEIPNSVISIGRWSFQDCTNLTTLTISNSVTSIGNAAFANCTSLTSITNNAITPQTIEDFVFYNVAKSSCALYVPAESLGAYQSAEVWKDFGNILPIDEPIETEEANINVVYKGNNDAPIYSELITLHLPVAPEIEGFTFLKWQVVAGDLVDAIVIQAVYVEDGSSAAPEVYINPSNPAQKLIRNGNVYILSGDHTYTLTGQEVR